MLFPIPSSNPGAAKSSKKTAKDRLRLFKQGHIRELYDEGNAVISKSPKEMAQAPARLQKSAQLAIGLDNVKTANVRLTKDAPVAIINDDRFKILQKLHPKSLQRSVNKLRRSCRFSHDLCSLAFTPEQIVRILRRLQRGKAGGLYGDTLDIYIKSARSLNLNKE